MTGRRLLIVSYSFLPSRSVSGVRWGTLSKYLGRLGFEITVVTSRLGGGMPQADVPNVISPADFESSKLLRRALGRRERASAKRAAPDAGGWLTKVVVPDGWLLTWVPFALRVARREVRRGAIDCVVTTSPGESTHLVGYGVRELGPAWVADFRDGWIFEPARPTFPSAPLRAFDQRLERAVVRRADRVVAVTEEIAADFRNRLGVDAVCIPNGWDPELAASPASAAAQLDPACDKVRLVYTGELGAGTTWRRPEPFFTALDRFHDEEPDLAANLEVLVAGRQTAKDIALLASIRNSDAVTHLGQLSREEALELQRSADALLLCTERSAATSKLFEYLVSGRPILHIGGEGAAARTIRETNGGVTVLADDEAGIVARLREIAQRTFRREQRAHGIQKYSYPQLAEQLAEVVDDAVLRRRRAGDMP